MNPPERAVPSDAATLSVWFSCGLCAGVAGAVLLEPTGGRAAGMLTLVVALAALAVGVPAARAAALRLPDARRALPTAAGLLLAGGLIPCLWTAQSPHGAVAMAAPCGLALGLAASALPISALAIVTLLGAGAAGWAAAGPWAGEALAAAGATACGCGLLFLARAITVPAPIPTTVSRPHAAETADPTRPADRYSRRTRP